MILLPWLLIKLSRKLCFVTVKNMQSRTANQLSRYLNITCSLYVRTSYNIKVLLIDIGFDPVAVKRPHVTVNMEAEREHVG